MKGASEVLDEAFHPPAPGGFSRLSRGWVQVNVQTAPSPALTPLWRRLAPLLARLLKKKQVRSFFFMRKPPGVRLRFYAPGSERTVRKALSAAFLEMRRAGIVARSYFGFYEPEYLLFGGAEGMSVAHEHFFYDSMLVLEHEALRGREGEAALSPATFSLLTFGDLVESLVGDGLENWAVWRNVRDLRRLKEPLPRRVLSAHRAAFKPFLAKARRRRLVGRLPAAEQALVRRYWEENERFSGRLRDLARSNRLDFGIRGVLPFYAVFHWNRCDLGPQMQSAIANSMDELLNPRKGFRP